MAEIIIDPEQRETKVIHDLVDFAGKDVLEVGCGNGRLTWRFAERARSVLALDPDANGIAQARATLPAHPGAHVSFEEGDVGTTRLPTGAFDVVVLAWSL